ncbi:MAG: hypothetical protein RR603_04365 [Kurthia sp.]
MNKVMKELDALYIHQERTEEGAAGAVLKATPKQLQDYVTDYMAASHYGYELRSANRLNHLIQKPYSAK